MTLTKMETVVGTVTIGDSNRQRLTVTDGGDDVDRDNNNNNQ